jgi:hypothetical protein
MKGRRQQPQREVDHRMTRFLYPWALALTLCTPLAHGAETSWRFTHSMAFTGPEPQPPKDKTGLTGRSLRIDDGKLIAPHPFTCESAKWETLQAPAEGLFEGALAAPAKEAAQALGIVTLPATLRRVTCSNAGFDFIQADDETLLTALDHRIWSLSNTPGTRAKADAPEGVVQSLLEAHFAADRGFLPRLVANKNRWMSTALRKAIATYFAKPRPQDEVPPIDGDAFTDSQEGPTRFAVGAARSEDGNQKRAEVVVRFADAWSTKRLTYALVREPAGWKVDDIRSEAPDARGLRDILEHD